ncbi:MAG: extracellular solute-binding protein [Chloroflexota bacterium]
MFKRSSRIAAGLMVLALPLAVMPTAAQDPSYDLRFTAHPDPGIDRVQQLLVQHYQEVTHPGATVTVEKFAASPGLDVQYATQAAAGTLADVIFTADLFVVPFAQNNITVDMQPLADADPSFNLDDVYPNMLDLGKVGDGLYMIPSSYDVVTMYYNKTMFEEAGAPLPEADWTWDDYIASCKIIREKTGNYCFTTADPPSGLDSASWWAYYVPWIVGYGGKVLSDDGKTALLSSPESLAGLQAYTDMWVKDDIGQPLDFSAGGSCFVVGKCATWFHIPAIMGVMRGLDPQPFEWDVQVIPSLPGGKFTGMGTYGYAVSADAKNPQAAWDFIKYLVSPEMQLSIMNNYAGMPLLKSLREDPAVTNLPGPPDNITAFIENGDNGILPTYFPGNCGSLYAGQINQEIKDAFEAVLTKTSSVTDAFTTANDNIQSCLDAG